MTDESRTDQRSKRGGRRLGAGRKRKRQVTLRTEFLSARTTLEVKKSIEERCIKDKVKESDLIHRALEEYLRKPGVADSSERSTKRIVFVLQSVEIE